MKKTTGSITNKILMFASLVLIAIVGIIFVLINFSMTNLTDSMMLDITSSVSRTVSNNISENLKNTSERFHHSRNDSVITSATATADEMKTFVESMLESMDFVWLGLYDMKGKVIAGSAGSPENISGRGFYEELRESNNLTLENTAIGNSGLEIIMGLPIHREWLSKIYLVGSQKYDVLFESLQNISIGDNSIAVIVDNNGSLVAHNKDTDIVISKSSLADILGNDSEATGVISKILSGQEGSQILSSSSSSLNGSLVYIGHTPVSETSWLLGIIAFRSDFTGVYNNALIISIGVGVLLLIASVVIFKFLLSHILTKPLQKITQNADLMSRGHFNYELDENITNRNDEIGQLGFAFSAVSDSIHSVIAEIALLTQLAKYGVLEKRTNIEKYDGDFNRILFGINETLDAFCSHLDSIPDAFSLLDESHETIYQNIAMKDLLLQHGIDTKDKGWLTRLITSGYSENPTPDLQKFFTANTAGGIKEIFHADIVVGDDEEDEALSYYSLTLKQVDTKSESGNVICVMLLLTDITDITNAKIESESANRAKSNFLATMSHEIRTPLNAIIGIAQIEMQKEDLPDEYETAFEKIYNSGNNLLGIINDILDLSKIETGKMELHLSEYDLPSLINDAVQINIVRIGDKQIKFIIEVDEKLPSRLLGDELRIKQILNNLLSNAIKYTEIGHVKLSVYHSQQHENAMLHIAIEDTGQGMKPEDQKRLFSEYRRFNMDANRTTEGIGLGLNITKKLVDMMDGTITVQSEYGKGSKFTINLCQKAVECEAIGKELAKHLCEFTFDETNQQTKQKIVYDLMPYGRVLVVDDVESNLYVAKGLLTPYKLDITIVDNGFAAIEKIEKGETYDMIFMDHMMPRIDGVETTQRIRDMGYNGVIIALTANALTGNKEMFMQNGFDGFIPKPIELRQLNSVLNTFIRDRYPEEAKKYQTVTEETELFRTKTVNPNLIDAFLRDAEKAVETLKRIAVTTKLRRQNDIVLFTTTVHAMKSALSNIKEYDKSKTALELEKAGRSGDTDFIFANTKNFIETLEKLISNLSPAESADGHDTSVEEDTAFLKEQLVNFVAACEDYDDTSAFAVLDLLKEKTWKKETLAVLNKIRDMLFLDSDFEAAAEQAKTRMDII